MNVRLILVVAIVISIACGCQRAAPVPDRVRLPTAQNTVASVTARDTNPGLSALLQVIDEYQDIELPRMADRPAPPPQIHQRSTNATSRYRGWHVDRLDASSWETLASSLNGLFKRMEPTEAAEFDRVVKYVMMQTLKDPTVAVKASTAQPMNDGEILALVRKYVHNRTPAQVTQLADMLHRAEAQEKTGEPGGAPVATAY